MAACPCSPTARAATISAAGQGGRLVGYTSTRRNGTDTDLYVMDPRDPESDRVVAEVKGGGWNFADFAPGGRQPRDRIYLGHQSNLYLLDVAPAS